MYLRNSLLRQNFSSDPSRIQIPYWKVSQNKANGCISNTRVGVRWKEWHKAIGGPLTNVPEESWEVVQKEKHPDMLHLLQFPYNGEPPKRLVASEPITPNPLHFVRNHGGIPDIDAEKWSLRLDGLVKNPQELTLKDLKDESKFGRIERLVTIQCSGTRRIEQISLYAGEGDEVSQKSLGRRDCCRCIWCSSLIFG